MAHFSLDLPHFRVSKATVVSSCHRWWISTTVGHTAPYLRGRISSLVKVQVKKIHFAELMFPAHFRSQYQDYFTVCEQYPRNSIQKSDNTWTRFCWFHQAEMGHYDSDKVFKVFLNVSSQSLQLFSNWPISSKSRTPCDARTTPWEALLYKNSKS